MTTSLDLPDICKATLMGALEPTFFKALCDPVRIALVADLATRADGAAVGELAKNCGIDLSGVSRHLKILHDAGIVTASRAGRQTHYTLCTDELAETLRRVADAVQACAAPPSGD